VKVIYIVILLASLAASLIAGNNLQSGQAVFVKNCKVCHGVQGEGNPAIAKALKVSIPDLGSKQVQSKSDDELKKDIAEGKGKMKAVKAVSGNDLRDVVLYIRSFAKD
jgi:mono/diheme cytochrome c family protein